MIRPIDLQNTLMVAQSAPALVRTDAAQRIDDQAAAAAFAAQLSRKDEEVAAADELNGNRVDAKEEARERDAARQRRRAARKPETEFETVVDAAAGSEEPAHLVDFAA